MDSLAWEFVSAWAKDCWLSFACSLSLQQPGSHASLPADHARYVALPRLRLPADISLHHTKPRESPCAGAWVLLLAWGARLACHAEASTE